MEGTRPALHTLTPTLTHTQTITITPCLNPWPLALHALSDVEVCNSTHHRSCPAHLQHRTERRHMQQQQQ